MHNLILNNAFITFAPVFIYSTIKRMIKLIVTDLDGTLLDDEKRIDSSFWKVLDLLINRGIVFIVASGRQYYMIENQFEDVLDKVIILAENGTYVSKNRKELFVNNMALHDARMLIKEGRKTPNTDIILCGKTSSYCENRYEPFVNEAKTYYKRFEVVDDLLAIEDEILKVTLWDHENAETNAYKYFQSYASRFKVAVAGDRWLDITRNDASKGNALKKLQNQLGISAEDTLIFGDYLNDIDMMPCGKYSYAMKNAHPKIKEASKYITRFDNNNNGVVKELESILKISIQAL